MTELATDDGWLLVRATPGAWPAGFASHAIVEYGFSGLNALVRYGFDFIKADLPLHTLLVHPEWGGQFTALPATALLAPDDDQRLWGSTSVRASNTSAVAYTLPASADLSRARRLLVAVQRAPAAAALALMLRDDATPANTITLTGATVTTAGAWEIQGFTLPQAGTFNWAGVTQFGYVTLDPTATYHIGPVLLEANPALDLVVMGGDGTSAGAGRFYGDGQAATKEAHGSYFTQPELPLADPAALAPVAEGQHRIDWAYLDLWERPLSYVERPSLREVALEGADTCTRTQLVAQVRLLRGDAVALANTPQAPSAAFETLPRLGRGVLTTKDKPAATLDPCADPCEPVIAGPYLGEENRLFRVEIHRAGNIGAANNAATAWFKWSRDNAGVVSALVADALAGVTSVQIEKPELFAVDDLVEIADDLVELATGPYEDRVTHTHHQRGELRKVVTVNLQTRRISWEDPSVVDPAEVPFHAALPRALRLAHHAKLTRWDGFAACTPGDISLASGVVIEFGGTGLTAGDHWLFATRTIDRSVERLIEAPPRGTRHGYYLLAAIHRSRGAAPAPEIVFAEDLRPRFVALPQLDASRIAYDPGACLAEHHIEGWDKVTTVQEAIDALCLADLSGDLRLHNKLLHGMGVICGLKLRCSKDREQIILGKGYALDCDGDLLHNAGDRAIDLVARAAAQGLLDNAGNGRVNLWIEQATTGVSTHIEPHVAQSFWDSVLEGSLLKDFYENTILALFNFFKAQLTPFPDTTLPLSNQHKLVFSLLNLVWQVVNSASGPYVFVSKAEHDLLEKFHADLQDLLASKTYCAMFDHLQVFPAYPYALPTGIDTMFGMLLMHHRIKRDPTGRYVMSYGTGNRIQVFDTTLREAVAITTFPGAPNLDVQDIAFNAAGTQMHVVGTMAHGTHVDSVFATATLAPPVAPAIAPTLAWGPAVVVCDVRFVTLATHANQANVMFAVGLSATDASRRGLYRFNPAAVPLAPAPIVNFNATGLFAIDTNGIDSVACEHSGGSQTGQFNVLRRINLNTLATLPAFTANGRNLQDDLAVANGAVFLTALDGSGNSTLLRFLLNPQQVLAPVPLGPATLWRLGLLPSRNVLALADANTYRARLFNTATGVLQANVRIPLQIMPACLAVGVGDRETYAINFLSNTVNVVDVAALLAGTPSFTNEPPVTLSAYRQQMLEAYTDLAGVFIQYLKDAFCDQFLIECHECGRDDKVYLGTIEIKGKRVFHICNFSKRHYAKSFRTWGYWLSTTLALPLLKQAFARFCCLKLVP
jgi:hypothetical protein